MGDQTYWELLRDVRWQRVRLEVMGSAGFACEHCGKSQGVTLHVHHSYYEKNKAPWEYPTESLHCLCEECHKKAQDLMLLMKRQMGKIDVGADLEALYGYALGLEALAFPMTVLVVFSYGVAQGVGAAWGLSADEVIDALQERSIDGHKLQELMSGKKGRN